MIFSSHYAYEKCINTIENNNADDEIIMSGLTAEKAGAINAPRVVECFLNIECKLLWEHEHFEGSIVKS